MMNNIKKLLAATLAVAASVYASERVYLAPVDMVGLNQNFAAPSEKLMNAYIEDDGRFVLVNHSEEDSIKAGDRDAANKKAIEKNCSKFIIAEFTRLGENVITSFKLYDVNNESPVWTDRLKAKNPDDFDPIIQRVARNIGTKRKAVDDDDIFSVTEQETKSPKKKGISAYYGLKIVGELSLNPAAEMDAGLGFFMFYDAKNILFGFDWTMSNLTESEDRSRFTDIALNLYYPFGTKNITPFIGGGLAYSWRTAYLDTDGIKDRDGKRIDKEYEANGLSMDLGGGIIFNRASRVMVILQANYFVDFFATPEVELKETKQGFDVVKNKNYMNGFKFSLGLALGF